MTHVEQQTVPFIAAAAPFWQRRLHRWAGRIARGHLRILYPDGSEQIVEGKEEGPSAVLRLHNARPVWQLFWGGALGFSRSYMDGDWDSPDVATFLEFALANEERLQTVTRPAGVFKTLARLRHLSRRNSRSGSRKNIAFHYDLGNSFYAKWLDETMTYSSALYASADQPLSDAQTAKYERIVQELGIGPDDHVLEIGCGWGGFAEHAARTTGCRVTGLTLSKEQAAFARDRLEKAGLADHTDIRIEDYRDCGGQFSKIVSIEMFEAVGEENWKTYFGRVRDLLAPGGRAMIQVITIDESRFEHYRRGADFIQTYIFPGGMLPSITAFRQSAEGNGLAVTETFRFGRDYERTLLEWDKAFVAHWATIKPMGFDERFYRMWRYYLHYCAAGFRTGRLDVVQFELNRP
ncbi:class I SAM-dependent methyltransferase [Ciceribacter sp. L1K23]|uniref:SAM-dependent methyltransferase n=1 Tax=Ciceribacter sp. L1K23 TaxID=2820276 RepID=UPI001B82C664|nr:cyclopropane-fatty-acyl-phospholipid synthase family protein [Ciceribacter sp. L1K23]MBR0558002.1 class I SAM-dependent methyltransferase [Ciceribacter sp. L1K23]